MCSSDLVGAACQTEGDVSPDTPGSGYVAYNENQMTHARAEDAYVSQLKMTANTQSLAASDAKITAAHASVVTKLNTFIGDNAQAMASLAAAQEAVAHYLSAQQLKRGRGERSVELERDLSSAMREAGRLAEALHVARGAAEAQPRQAESQLVLAAALREMGRVDEASEHAQLEARLDVLASAPAPGFSGRATDVAILLRSGRYHQIRAMMAAEGSAEEAEELDRKSVV